jgi:hypothetical protein
MTMMSCETNKVQTVRQCSQNSENMSVESDSAIVFVNEMVPATATLVDIAELVEVSGIPTGCTDLGIVADSAIITKPDVIASNIPRYLFPVAQQQALIESSSVAVSSSLDNPVPSEPPLRRDSDAAPMLSPASVVQRRLRISCRTAPRTVSFPHVVPVSLPVLRSRRGFRQTMKSATGAARRQCWSRSSNVQWNAQC